MPAQAALKPAATESRHGGQDLTGAENPVNEFDEGLHERFMLWKDQSGHSANHIARMISRSAALVSQYINQKYPGSVAEIEKDIATLLHREENLEFTTAEGVFCNTNPSTLIWEVIQYCDEEQDMGVAVGPAGIGKTETCNEYKRRNRGTVFVTADIATRAVGTVLHMLAKSVGGTPRQQSNSALLHAIIDKLKHSRRLILVDEAHFLTWEAFEVIRKIHDCAKVGVAYVGMERMYDQMRGGDNRAMLFDQIYSRIAIKRDGLKLKKKDVKLLAGAMWPDLDKACINYLFSKAQGKGKFRTVLKLLKGAVKRHKNFSVPMDLTLLEEAAGFLMTSNEGS